MIDWIILPDDAARQCDIDKAPLVDLKFVSGWLSQSSAFLRCIGTPAIMKTTRSAAPASF